ncbi:MAG: 5-formyltetrahydrofolate cyclo-ligase [bacterium]|nr:5-formyltetrahydrofolate cyclo-ligase [bacterium]
MYHLDNHDKQRIRERMRALRHSLSPEQVRSAGIAVTGGVLDRPETAAAGTVCVYAHTCKEIPTDMLMDRLLEKGKTVAVPDWEGWKQGFGLRTAAIAGLNDLDLESRVVPQPSRVEGNIVPVDEIDIFLLPGLAFDLRGNRLGMGGGYFDRLLARASSTATFLGLAYNFQVITHLPAESHDIRVHDVVTPGHAGARGVNDKQEGIEYDT